MSRRHLRSLALVATLLLGVACGDDTDEATPADAAPAEDPPQEAPAPDGHGDPRPFQRIEPAGFDDPAFSGAGLDLWAEEVPGVVDVRISSSVDGYEQPALWLAHDRDEDRPLLVVLHSWSVDYQQHVGIPYARWAAENGWAMIHPDFRGVLDRPDATGSDLAVQDVIDAIDYAATHTPVDLDRVFVTGFSGGGMMSLVMAGRHPERFAGVVAWVPIHDLVEWYAFAPGWAYARQIVASCGGDPTAVAEAGEECRRRSPSAHLDAAREAGLAVYVAHGLSDPIVPPIHTAWVFNQLADPDDRFTDEEMEAIANHERPARPDGQVDIETYFRGPDPAVLFARSSGEVTAVFFDGEHTGAYNPGLEWMARRAEEVE